MMPPIIGWLTGLWRDRPPKPQPIQPMDPDEERALNEVRARRKLREMAGKGGDDG